MGNQQSVYDPDAEAEVTDSQCKLIYIGTDPFFPFLHLPNKTRQMIYELVFSYEIITVTSEQGKGSIKLSGKALALLLTNHQVRSEAMPILYSTVLLKIKCPTYIRPLSDFIGWNMCERIRHIQLDLIGMACPDLLLHRTLQHKYPDLQTLIFNTQAWYPPAESNPVVYRKACFNHHIMADRRALECVDYDADYEVLLRVSIVGDKVNLSSPPQKHTVMLYVPNIYWFQVRPWFLELRKLLHRLSLVR